MLSEFLNPLFILKILDESGRRVPQDPDDSIGRRILEPLHERTIPTRVLFVFVHCAVGK